MKKISRLTEPELSELCGGILSGLGIDKPQKFDAKGIEQAFRAQIVRESTDKMFRADEVWLCIFLRPSGPVTPRQVRAVADAAIASGAHSLWLVVFGTVPFDVEGRLRETLARQSIEVALLAGPLAESLAADYAPRDVKTESADFSFARLRRLAQAEFESAPWRKHFQTSSLQPGRVLPLQAEEDAALAEADLVRVLHGGSFLLLGEPGAGKSTSLLALARELASAGPYTPVLLPLGRFRGDFWDILCEVLAPGAEPVARSTAQALVESGVLVVLLDGINEVQNPDLQARLVEELNRLTDPTEPSARSRWVVSGRVHDYQQGHQHLIHLEPRRWEIQPFTADLVFRLLADALGEAQGLALYEELGASVGELCTNPLLLNMVLKVHVQKGRTPLGLGALYRQFVALLLEWGSDRSLQTGGREALARLWPEPLTEESYRELAQAALTALSSASSTQIPWREAQQCFADALSRSHHPEQAAAALLDDLTRRGLLRYDFANRVSFLHHTFQEYFHALQLRGRPVEGLIPKGGVAAADREAIAFLAGLLDDPAPLVRRALEVDPALAFEILRDAPAAVPADLVQQLARTLWSRTLASGHYFGFNRSWALLFKRLAGLVDRPVEALAREIDASSDRNRQTAHLMIFYAELGDSRSQQRLLAEAVGAEEVPEALLFAAAQTAYGSKDYQRAVELYTRYLEKHPGTSGALHNRALALKELGGKDAALKDFEQAISLKGSATELTSYASLLWQVGRKEEAREQARIALESDPKYATAHSLLAGWLEPEDPEAALRNRELAVNHAPHDEDLRLYLSRLLGLQEKLAQHAGAIRTLRQMIALSPTSPEVRSWKQKIAAHRQELDAEARTRSMRERLQEQGELPLPILVVEWLKAAGLAVDHATSSWILARGRRDVPGPLPVVLMPEPRVTASGLRAALDATRRQVPEVRHVLVATAAETLELDARHLWASLQEELTLGLISALEIRDALLQSDVECRLLLDRVLNRSGRLEDPFDYKGVVREPTEFFGRAADIADLTARISRGRQVGLYGIHKIGKSSLMEQLRRNLHISHPEITAVQIELDGHGKGPSDFYSRVLEKLPGAAELPPMLSPTAFRRALTEYHQRRAKERPGHRLLLMVDEYAFLIPDSQGEGGWPGFLEVLELLKALHQEGWLLLLPCGRTAALNRQASWGKAENPFIDLLHPCFLGPLPRPENDALMTTLGLRAKLKFTPEALTEVYAETAGHPSFSRALGSQILRDGPGKVGADRVRSAVQAFLKSRDQTNILRAIYEARMDRDEQQIARTLALKGPQPRRDLFPAAADEARRRQIRDALSNLIDTTVLVEEGGKIAHRYGLLRRLIHREAEELGMSAEPAKASRRR